MNWDVKRNTEENPKCFFRKTNSQTKKRKEREEGRGGGKGVVTGEERDGEGRGGDGMGGGRGGEEERRGEGRGGEHTSRKQSRWFYKKPMSVSCPAVALASWGWGTPLVEGSTWRGCPGSLLSLPPQLGQADVSFFEFNTFVVLYLAKILFKIFSSTFRHDYTYIYTWAGW